MLLGAHVSTAGGVDRAPGNARAIGAECMQVFTRNQRRWESPAIRAEVAEHYRSELSLGPAGPVLAHDSYLINLAADDPEKRRRSRGAFGDEIRRADRLDIPFLVAHPGSHLGAGVAEGIRRFTRELDRCLDEAGPESGVTVLLENTAGQGTNLGSDLGELRDIIGSSRHGQRLGVCVDSCHAFAAGHDLRSDAGYEATMEALDRAVGFARVRAWHLNDSVGELGCRRDRHADLGEGEIGMAAFERLVRDPRWADRPGCLETPGGPGTWAADIARLARAREA
jgi:deoxyribonuclease IV